MIDRNQTAIVAALRAAGCSVEPRLARVGGGCPDILVGRNGVTYLMEIKDSEKPPSERRLTEKEVVWHREWMGQVCVVKTIAEALTAVGIVLQSP